VEIVDCNVSRVDMLDTAIDGFVDQLKQSFARIMKDQQAVKLGSFSLEEGVEGGQCEPD